jgi:hypothetical protein
MKRSLSMALLAVLFAAPSLMAQAAEDTYNHAEVGVFADYFNLSRTSPHINFVGVGGRAAFNVRSSVQIEAEMAYDFDRNFSSSFSNGVSTQFVSSRLHTIHALFGVSNLTGTSGFTSSISDVTTGNTAAAILPGAGIEGFWGPIGLRVDVGDEIYFKNGTHNNLRATFGPTFRF